MGSKQKIHTVSMTTPFRFSSFASALTSSSSTAQEHLIPTGSWTAYFHEPEDASWTADSYKKLQELTTWESLGSLFKELGPHKTTNGLLRIMMGQASPLWEDRANIRGGSYCLKVPRRNAIDVYERYVAAAALGQCSKNPANTIVGVTISPKKGFCIIKIWNLDAHAFHSPDNIYLLHDEVRESEILYRNHTDQRM